MKKSLTVYAKQISKRFSKMESLPRESFILSKIPYDIHCGRHSGFPECCIKFFITKWIWIWDDKNSKEMKKHRARLNKHHPGYIACPKCIRKKNFIKLKPCPKSCKLRRLVWGKDWWKKK